MKLIRELLEQSLDVQTNTKLTEGKDMHEKGNSSFEGTTSEQQLAKAGKADTNNKISKIWHDYFADDDTLKSLVPKTPKAIFDKLATHPDFVFRGRAAKFSPHREHDSLITDKMDLVRNNFVHKPHMHKVLMNDKRPWVRKSVAVYSRDPEVLNHLTKDSDEDVSSLAKVLKDHYEMNTKKD